MSPSSRKRRWIEANEKLINEIGAEEWLSRLLTVLEGSYPTNPNDPTIANGYTRDA